MNLKTTLILVLLSSITVSGLTYSYLTGQFNPPSLTIFHAGSLSIPLEKIGKEFAKTHTGISIAYESSGSVNAIRKITDLHRSCDVLASADYSLIPGMMYPKYANWTIIFASNEMVIAYTNMSRYYDEINSTNWYKILNRTEVKIGRSNPSKDPCGYRALLVFQLASIYYGDPAINSSLWNHSNTIIKPKSVELLSALESGQIDYAFEYKSVAIQHNLRYVKLPDEINLSKFELKDYYVRVNVTIKKDGEKFVINGSPILYGLTIPKNAEHLNLALDFVKLILSEKGREILTECGQNVLHPAYVDNVQNVPVKLKSFVENLP
ncbi:tungstate ABC transporter substrate-binding protein WtpA [Candidatus Bathyarchaeota archaeon]|nr:tungstate ABC transporter substrate-binding protein WtpA [Candidatus Bathyarchaeota archaeon]